MPYSDEISPRGPILDPEQPTTLGMDEYGATAQGQPHQAAYGPMLYPRGAVDAALRFAQASMEAFYSPGKEAPWKVAEEWQIANISYGVEYGNQDYRNMNAAQSNANTWRTKLPKFGPRASTPQIVNNLASSPGESLVGDDSSILALLGIQG